MEGLVVRFLVNAVALWAADFLLLDVQGPANVVNYLLVALIFGLVNALVRPILKALTCPLVILTLGLSTLVIIGVMLWLTSVSARNFDLGFRVTSFTGAFLGAIVISVARLVLTLLVRE